MDIITERQLETAVEIAHSLFERGKVSGSTANISIRIGDFIYISGSGTSFGTLEKEQFSTLLLDETQQGISASRYDLPVQAGNERGGTYTQFLFCPVVLSGT